MRPVDFDQQNRVFGEDQPEYTPLPAHVTEDNVVTTCWHLSLRERLRVLFTGRVYFSSMTFGSSLHPQLASVQVPKD